VEPAAAPAPEPQGQLGPGLLESVWRYRWWVAAATVLAALAGFAASFLQATVYEAEARMLLTDPESSGLFGDDTGSNSSGERFVRNQAASADSPKVYQRAAERLDGRLTWEEIQERVEVRPSTNVDVLTVLGRAPTPEDAAELTNAVARAYQDLRSQAVQRRADEATAELEESITQQRQIIQQAEARLQGDPENARAQAERDAAVNQLMSFQGRVDQIKVDAALFGSGVERFTQARPPETPAQPRPGRNSAVAAVLGLLASSALAWWRAEQSQSADRRQDAAPVLRAPLLAQVPDFKSVGATGLDPARSAPHSPAGEAYQFLMSSLEHALAQVEGRSVIVTSAGPGNGKTLTAFNLAIAAARGGQRVALCDADERVQGLTALAGVSATPGVTDLADDDMPLEGCVASVDVAGRGALPLVPCGTRPANAAGFFRTPGFRKSLARVTEHADLVVLDTPPLLTVADTSAIAGHVDGIVAVVTKGTPLKTLEEMRERLEFVGTPVLGYVFNRADTRSGTSYGYGYGYGYGYTGEATSNGQPSPASASRAGGNGHSPSRPAWSTDAAGKPSPR
jgi:Mrp family chromosome partitioning ATPase/capsular polysaccharide biosynthesis protein